MFEVSRSPISSTRDWSRFRSSMLPSLMYLPIPRSGGSPTPNRVEAISVQPRRPMREGDAATRKRKRSLGVDIASDDAHFGVLRLDALLLDGRWQRVGVVAILPPTKAVTQPLGLNRPLASAPPRAARGAQHYLRTPHSTLRAVSNRSGGTAHHAAGSGESLAISLHIRPKQDRPAVASAALSLRARKCPRGNAAAMIGGHPFDPEWWRIALHCTSRFVSRVTRACWRRGARVG